MKQEHSSFVFLFVGLAAGLALSAVLSDKNTADREIIVERCDTIIVTDTHFIDFPVVVDVEISENEIEVPLQAIVIRSDSLIVLPIEIKTYTGDGYKAQISGYRPNLDWIELYPETRYITKETAIKKPASRWGIGIQAGYGLGIASGKAVHGPYIGVGISYNILRF